MREYVTIGSTPCDEDCVQVGSDDYEERALAECHRFVGLLRRMFGQEPAGAKLAVKAFPHDYGNYHEVVVFYDRDNAEAVKYAFNVENNQPATWEG